MQKNYNPYLIEYIDNLDYFSYPYILQENFLTDLPKLISNNIHTLTEKYKNWMNSNKKIVEENKNLHSKVSKIINKGAKNTSELLKNSHNTTEINHSVNETIIKIIKITLKLGGSIALFACVYYINTFLLETLNIIIINPDLAMYIGAILCGPLIEEWAKRISIALNMDNIFMPIFTGGEFLIYLKRIILNALTRPASIFSKVIEIITGIIMRILGIKFHYFTKDLQKIVDYDPKTGKFTGKEGLRIGMLLHAMWNSLYLIPVVLGIMGNKELLIKGLEFKKKKRIAKLQPITV